MSLFRQCVDFLGLITATKKLQAIKLLTYLKTFGALKYYLSFISYLRSYIHFYAYLLKPLHFLKTKLLKSAPVSSQQK